LALFAVGKLGRRAGGLVWNNCDLEGVDSMLPGGSRPRGKTCLQVGGLGAPVSRRGRFLCCLGTS
jgi:hypothetical protein